MPGDSEFIIPWPEHAPDSCYEMIHGTDKDKPAVRNWISSKALLFSVRLMKGNSSPFYKGNKLKNASSYSKWASENTATIYFQ